MANLVVVTTAVSGMNGDLAERASTRRAEGHACTDGGGPLERQRPSREGLGRCGGSKRIDMLQLRADATLREGSWKESKGKSKGGDGGKPTAKARR